MIKLIIKFVSIGALLLVIFACDDNDDRNNYQSEYDRSAESIGISNASISTSKEISEAEFNDTILNVTERKVSKNAQLDISVKSLLLLRVMNILLSLNLFALPIKFLSPYTTSNDLVIFF